MMGIYQIQHRESGKVYVGSTKDLTRRKREHFRLLSRGAHRNPYLLAAFNKYGHEAFQWSVLEEVADVRELLDREQVWLDRTQAADSKHGYNLTPTAGSNRGWKQSAETIRRRSEALRGKPKPLSVEGLARLVTMNKTRHRSPEERAANRDNMLRDRDTPEYREKLSRGRKGKTHTPEALAKMAKAKTGKARTTEERKKISAALKGRPKSPETRERMRQAAQRRRLNTEPPSTTSGGCPTPSPESCRSQNP